MSWNNAPRLNKLTASQQGGNRGAQIWGVDFKGKLYTCYQTSPGGSWSDWGGGGGWSDPEEPKAIYELAASQTDPDGRVYFWALDMKHQLWARWQTSPGGNWSPWQKDFNNPPGPNRPIKLAATRGGSGHGIHLFAILEDGFLVYSASILPAGNFSGWANFPETPEKSRFIRPAHAAETEAARIIAARRVAPTTRGPSRPRSLRLKQSARPARPTPHLRANLSAPAFAV